MYIKISKSSWNKIVTLTLFMCILLFLMGCSKDKNTLGEPLKLSAFKLNTIVELTVYNPVEPQVLDKAMELCDYYESIFSRTLESSELYRLNHRQLQLVDGTTNTYIISEELAELIEYGLHYSELSKGEFDITIGGISSLWDFTSAKIIPHENEIKSALQYVNYKNIQLDKNYITMKNEEVVIDLGAIAKGHIADKLKEYLEEAGVTSGIINLGGNVLCIGEKLVEANETLIPFQIGIQKPFADRNEMVSIMSLTDVTVVSSGVYERFFEVDGKNYHHLLDTKTGYPIENNIIGVTIITEKSVDGDGLSTSVFALGLEEGMKLIEETKNTYGVFITSDYKLHYSKGFHDNIKVTEVMEGE